MRLRVTGFALLGSLLIPALTWATVLSGMIDSGDPGTTAQNVLAQDSLFRAGVLLELVAAAFNALLPVLLYLALAKVSRTVALVGLVLKVTEASLAAVIALGHFAALLILESASGTGHGREAGQLELMVGSFLNAYLPLTAVLGLLLGTSMLAFSYLLLKSKLIPRALAVFGLIAYSMVLACDGLVLLSPDVAGFAVVPVLGAAPVSLFTLLAGLYFMCAGTRAVPASCQHREENHP